MTVSCPHRPYEGSQQERDREVLYLRTGPHRPYEGSQPGLQEEDMPSVDEVLIARTRGRNAARWAPVCET